MRDMNTIGLEVFCSLWRKSRIKNEQLKRQDLDFKINSKHVADVELGNQLLSGYSATEHP